MHIQQFVTSVICLSYFFTDTLIKREKGSWSFNASVMVGMSIFKVVVAVWTLLTDRP